MGSYMYSLWDVKIPLTLFLFFPQQGLYFFTVLLDNFLFIEYAKIIFWKGTYSVPTFSLPAFFLSKLTAPDRRDEHFWI